MRRQELMGGHKARTAQVMNIKAGRASIYGVGCLLAMVANAAARGRFVVVHDAQVIVR